MYRFTVIESKSQQLIFVKIDKLIIKVIWKYKGPEKIK